MLHAPISKIIISLSLAQQGRWNFNLNILYTILKSGKNYCFTAPSNNLIIATLDSNAKSLNWDSWGTIEKEILMLRLHPLI